MSRQTLHNRYADIESIVAEAIRRHNRESINALASTIRVVEAPAARLEQLVRHVVSLGAHAHHAAAMRHGLSAAARAGLTDYDDALDERISEVLTSGREGSEFRRDLTVDSDTVLVRHMLNGLAELSAARPDEAARLANAGTIRILAAVGAR